MKPAELALYRDLLGDIRHRVRGAQQRAALSVNAEMLLMYWDIGRLIAAPPLPYSDPDLNRFDRPSDCSPTSADRLILG